MQALRTVMASYASGAHFIGLQRRVGLQNWAMLLHGLARAGGHCDPGACACVCVALLLFFFVSLCVCVCVSDTGLLKIRLCVHVYVRHASDTGLLKIRFRGLELRVG